MRDSPARFVENSQEAALHVYCKQLLKSKLFKGFYKERRYIDAVNGYRDQIIINRSEKDLKLILEDVESSLRQYYEGKSLPMWIGITSSLQSSASDTCLWVELEELAFDQYWFSIKSLRLRENEVIIKLKPVRLVEPESERALVATSSSLESTESPEPVGLQDFVKLFVSWGESTKQTLYEFMSKDISKENLAAAFKFVILFCISLFTLSIEAIRFLGIFTIHFMAEFRKILVVFTPIIMRIIDVCGKIIGGLYILLAMLWRDVKKKDAPPQHQAIGYNRPKYQRISNKPLYRYSFENWPMEGEKTAETPR